MQRLAKHLCLTTLFFACLWLTSVLAEENSSTQDQLDQIELEIDSLNSSASIKREKIIAYQEQIKSFDQQISVVSRRRHSILKEIAQIKSLLDKLSAQDQQLVDKIDQEQRLLGTHVTLAWQNIVSSGVLVQADDNNQRLMHNTWLEYLAAQRVAALERIKDQNRELITLREQQQASIQNLNQAVANEEEEQRLLGEKKTERQTTIRTLETEFASTAEKISLLEQDRDELTAIIDRLKAARDDNAFVEKGTEFASLQGKLPWPHTGKITAAATAGHYIQANNGDPVYAIAAGRVAYSEWLKGFGLLVIIDHGDGYMSLYGNNESIYRKTGDWVSAGDTISAAGQSGGRQQAGLYFEIRDTGKTLDARKWCNSDISVNQIQRQATNQ